MPISSSLMSPGLMQEGHLLQENEWTWEPQHCKDGASAGSYGIVLWGSTLNSWRVGVMLVALGATNGLTGLDTVSRDCGFACLVCGWLAGEWPEHAQETKGQCTDLGDNCHLFTPSDSTDHNI